MCANQGCSIPVNVEFDEVFPREYLYQGMDEKYIRFIDINGMIPKLRLYFHLSSNNDVALKCGLRHSKQVVYRINCKDMIEQCYNFYHSVNGVWLMKSVFDGISFKKLFYCKG